MEHSTRGKSFNLDNFTVHDVEYVVQFNGDRFVTGSSVEKLSESFSIQSGVALDTSSIEEPNYLYESDELKILMHVSDRMYHVLLDTIPLIFKINKLYPDAMFVLYLRGNPGSEQSNIFHRGLVDMLDDLNINYFLTYNSFDSIHSQVYKISRFIYLDETRFNLHNAISLLDVRYAIDYLKKSAGVDANVEAARKVYLTRPESVNKFGAELFTEDGSYPDDVRIYEEEKLKDFFSSHGFEIVTPETKFSSLAEQIRYMSEVQVLAAVSSSGLANSLFMVPDKKVIEILAEVVTLNETLPDGRLTTNQTLTSEYFPLSFVMGHTHLMIPTNRNAEAAVEKLRRQQEL